MAGYKIRINTQEAKTNTDSLRQKIKELGAESLLSEKKLGQLENRAKQRAGMDKLSKGLDDVTKATKMTRIESARLHSQLGDYKGALASLTKGFSGLASIVGGVSFAKFAYDIKRAIDFSLDSFADYEEALTDMGKVTSENLDVIDKKIKSLPAVLGSGTELMKGYYQVISAGVTDTSKAMDLLVIASKASKAAHVDQAETIKALTKFMAGYAGEIETATEAADILFATERSGQTTFQELVPIIGDLANLSKSMGLSAYEMSAGLAALTQTAGGTAEAATQLRATLIALMKTEGKDWEQLFDKMGYSSMKAAIEAIGYKDALLLVQKTAKDLGIEISDLIGRQEGILGVQALLQDEFKRFDSSLKTAKEGVGGMEKAFSEYEKELKAVRETFNNTIKSIGVEIGDVFEEPVKASLSGVVIALNAAKEPMRSFAREIAEEFKDVASAFELVTVAVTSVINILNELQQIKIDPKNYLPYPFNVLTQLKDWAKEKGIKFDLKNLIPGIGGDVIEGLSELNDLRKTPENQAGKRFPIKRQSATEGLLQLQPAVQKTVLEELEQVYAEIYKDVEKQILLDDKLIGGAEKLVKLSRTEEQIKKEQEETEKKLQLLAEQRERKHALEVLQVEKTIDSYERLERAGEITSEESISKQILAQQQLLKINSQYLGELKENTNEWVSQKQEVENIKGKIEDLQVDAQIAHEKTLKQMQAEEETFLKMKVKEVELAEKLQKISPEISTKKQIQLYTEILKKQEDFLKGLNKVKDPEAWLEQQEQIDATRDKLVELNAELQKYVDTFAGGMKAGFDRWMYNARTAFENGVKFAEDTAQAMEHAFSTFFFDVFEGKLNDLGSYFKAFLTDIKRSISNIIGQTVTRSILGSLGFGSFIPGIGVSGGMGTGSAFTATGSSWLGSLLGISAGSAFSGLFSNSIFGGLQETLAHGLADLGFVDSGMFLGSMSDALFGGLTAGVGSFLLGGLTTGNWGSSAITGIGAGLGTAIGGPIGGLVGGFIGNIVGGIFGGGSQHKPSVSGRYELTPNRENLFDITNTYFGSKRLDASQADSANKYAQQVLEQTVDIYRQIYSIMGDKYKDEIFNQLTTFEVSGYSKSSHLEDIWKAMVDIMATQIKEKVTPAFKSAVTSYASDVLFNEDFQEIAGKTKSTSAVNRVRESLLVGSWDLNDPEQMLQYAQGIQSYIAALNQVATIFDAIEQQVNSVLAPTTAYEQELQAINAQFDSWISTLKQLGATELAIYEIEQKRTSVLTEIESRFATEREKIKTNVQRYVDEFAGNLNEFEVVINQINDQFDNWKDQLKDFGGTLEELTALELKREEAIGQYVLQSIKNSIAEIDSVISSLRSGEMAPVQSAESYILKYQKLLEAAQSGTSEDTQALLQFVPKYIDYMKDFTDNYAALTDSVSSDLEALKTSLTSIMPADVVDVLRVETNQYLLDISDSLKTLIQLSENAQPINYTPTVPQYTGTAQTFTMPNFNMSELGASIAKNISNVYIANNGPEEIHVHVEIDGNEIGTAVARQVYTNPELATAIQRIN